MSLLSAYIYHVRKGTPLGKSMMRSPLQSFFFLMKGNAVYHDDQSFINRLYIKWAKQATRQRPEVNESVSN
jgi:hypothetical protein